MKSLLAVIFALFFLFNMSLVVAAGGENMAVKKSDLSRKLKKRISAQKMEKRLQGKKFRLIALQKKNTKECLFYRYNSMPLYWLLE